MAARPKKYGAGKGQVPPDRTSYDITNEYDWTSIPVGSDYRKEAPSAYVGAYQLDFSQLQQFIDGYVNIATANTIAGMHDELDPGMVFYRNLYKTTNNIANFNFPFFSDEIRQFTSEYTDTFSPISQRGAQFMGAKTIMGLGEGAESMIGGTLALASAGANMGGNAMADKIGDLASGAMSVAGDAIKEKTGLDMPGLQTVGAPGSYIETPKFYQYSNTDSALDVNFVLSNTINGKEGYQKNQKFIKEFTKMNRPRRMGAIGMTFPAIYHIEVPGLRYIEWAFLSNFTVSLMGARRKIDNEILPEAFRCQFNFRSLTVEVANFVDKIDDIAPYNDEEGGWLSLRALADEARAKSLKEEQEAAKRMQLNKSREHGSQEKRWAMEMDRRRKEANVARLADAHAKADLNNDGEIKGAAEMARFNELEDGLTSDIARARHKEFLREAGATESFEDFQAAEAAGGPITNPVTPLPNDAELSKSAAQKAAEAEQIIPDSNLPNFDQPLEDVGGPGNLLDQAAPTPVQDLPAGPAGQVSPVIPNADVARAEIAAQPRSIDDMSPEEIRGLSPAQLEAAWAADPSGAAAFQADN